MQIKLKLKYRLGNNYKNQKSKSNMAGKASRNKIDAKQKRALKHWPERVMHVDGLTGQVRMQLTGVMLQHTGTSVIPVKDE